MIDYSEIIKEGELVADRVSHIIRELYDSDDPIIRNYAVNWVDLACISVSFSLEVYPFNPREIPKFIVTISEASPENYAFKGQIEEIYFESYSSIIEVITEW